MHDSFFDTNIILYLLDDNSHKAEIAESLLKQGGHISVQVLNETLVNCRRKNALSWHESEEFIHGIELLCEVNSLNHSTHILGRAIAQRYQLSIYDSMIVASALESGCTTLYSEDMHNGLVIEDILTITNPFIHHVSESDKSFGTCYTGA